MANLDKTGLEIAIIGYSGRFNNCKNMEEYWRSLCNGMETFKVFDEEDLDDLGVPEEVYHEENYVKANGVLCDKDCFDAQFFGYTPKEGVIMDPQIRIFHEVVWSALEMAGYVPGKNNKKIGLYASAANNSLWESLMMLNGENEVGSMATSYFTNKDYLCSLVAYNLNLKGPAIAIQTACSSSLVAIHKAGRALLTGDCQIAVAGGVRVSLLKRGGYTYQENLILSPDGHCRVFDANAQGTLDGEGAGVLVLKRFKDALKDGDTIHAIIKGSAVNNDGQEKIGYTAPSINGQIQVIKKALKVAKIKPESVSYIETHGTGTKIGDPVEVNALKRAYDQKGKQMIPIASVKSNIGHLDTAAGIASVIKVVLMLKNKKIPASLYYNQANPALEIENSPFFVNDKLINWGSEYPLLRAGVSSFGIGGTNCHLILEEFLEEETNIKTEKRNYSINLSARSEKKLKETSSYLAAYLKENRNLSLKNIAYTLNCGRIDSDFRKTFSVSTFEELLQKLQDNLGSSFQTKKENFKSCVFVFSGQGAQYVNMGKELYDSNPFFKSQMDICLSLIQKHHQLSLSKILFQAKIVDETQINETLYAQLSLFSICYSLAALLLKLGIKPAALIGHSIGEYAAAVVSGVLDLEDAIQIIGKRASLMQSVEKGKMYAVFIEESDLKQIIPEEIEIAAVNSDHLIVISGENSAMITFQQTLKSREIDYRELKTSHAFHSTMMESILEEYKSFLNDFNFRKGQIPLISNLSGTFFDKEIDATYWCQHLRNTVRFKDGIETLLIKGYKTFLEVGPGNQLTKLVGKIAGKENIVYPISTLKKLGSEDNDSEVLLLSLSKLWQLGQVINWDKFYEGQGGKRIPLPGILFDKTKFPVPSGILSLLDNWGRSNNGLSEQEGLGRWVFKTVWKARKIIDLFPENYWEGKQILVFCDEEGAADQLMTQINTEKTTFITVRIGDNYQKLTPTSYIINPQKVKDYSQLMEDLKVDYSDISSLLHCWGWSKAGGSTIDHLDEVLHQGYLSLSFIAKNLQSNSYNQDIDFIVLTDKAIKVKEEDTLNPLKSMLIGALKVISVEYDNLKCKLIDIPRHDLNDGKSLLALNKEMAFKNHQIIVSYRQGRRYVPVIQRAKKDKELSNPLHQKGCYLIPGGLGGMGLSIAYDIAQKEKAKLALISRRNFPAKEEWADWLLKHGPEEKTRKIIEKLQAMENFGAEVCLLKGDISDFEQMKKIITQVKAELGEISGVIWAAGVIDYDGIIQRRNTEKFIANTKPKVQGLLHLEQLLDFEKLDFITLFSSIGNVYYKDKFGQVAYNVANEFFDAYSLSYSGKCKLSTIVWCDWKNVGMSVDSIVKKYEGITSDGINELLEDGLLPEEGVAVFRKIISYPPATYIVSKSDLIEGLKKHDHRGEESQIETKQIEIPVFERPSLSTAYEEPYEELQIQLANICRNLFGIDRVGIQDDFLELGGDSLMAIQFINQIKKELGVKISLEEFFSSPTVAAFAKLISSKKKAGTQFNTLTSDVVPRVEKQPFYPLSSAQSRIYFLYEFDKTSTAYNMPKIIKAKGILDHARLTIAFKKLINRHENFRTTFAIVNQVPVQIIKEKIDFEIEYLGVLDKKEDEMIDAFIQPFNLNKDILLRVGLADVAPGEFFLMIDFHHIISDGFSHSILMKEFMSFYNEEQLPNLNLQYKDFVVWQQSEKQQAQIVKERGFWLREFSEIPEVLELPIDFKRPLIKSYEGEVIGVKLDMQESRGLRALAEREKATLFMVVFAIYNVLLGKLANSEDIVIGSPVAGRQHTDLENMIGMFVNTLPIRSFPKNELTFREFLSNVKSKTLACFDNQSLQYEELLEEIKIERDTSRNPLFDVLFVFDNFREPEFEIPGLELSPYSGVHKVSKFDLTLTAIDSEEGIIFNFEYASSILKKATIEKFITYFKNIIAAVVANMETKIADIIILPIAEKQKLLFEFNATEAYYPKEKTIIDIFREQAHKKPKNIAVRFGDESLTYAELDEQSGKIAAYLNDKIGVEPGDLIGLMLEREFYLIPTIFGILKTGAAYVPIDSRFPFDRIKTIVEDAGLKALITREQYLGGKTILGLPIVNLDESLEEIMTCPSLSSDVNFTSDQLAYVIYTSGSTGKPKGVMIEHHSVVNRILWMDKAYPITETDVLLQKTPIVFDVSVWELFWWSFKGASLTLLQPEEEKSPEDILKTIARDQVTTLHFVPSMLNAFLKDLEGISDYKGLKSIRKIFVSGEALKTEQVNRFGDTLNKNCGSRLINLYGPTEATVDVSYYECDFANIPEFIPIGKPIDNIQLYILDKNNNIVATGVRGELCIGGVGLARGYLNNKKLTDEKFIPNPFMPGERLYKTGDLASWLSNGEIAFWGRIDNQVKIRGFRMELGEIEACLLNHEQIKEAVVLVKKQGDEKVLVAYYISEEEIEVSTLRTYLSTTLPEYMVPFLYVRLEVFPLTVNGKLNRKALPKPERITGDDYKPASNETEEKLVDIWSEVLNMEKENISIYTNFFDIGGHSLKIIQMNRMVNEVFKVNISVANIFRLTNINAIANYLINGDNKIKEIEDSLDEREEALDFLREL